jgi:hypothetical protein
MGRSEIHPEEITRPISMPKHCDRCGNVTRAGYHWHVAGFGLMRLCLICERLAELNARRS